MAGGAGVALVALAATAGGGITQGLRPGVVYEGAIRVDGNTVSLLIGGQALNLKTGMQFLDGQRVQAQLMRTAEGMQVRISLPGSGSAAPAAPQGQGNPPGLPNAATPQTGQPGQTAQPPPAGSSPSQTPAGAPLPRAAPGQQAPATALGSQPRPDASPANQQAVRPAGQAGSGPQAPAGSAPLPAAQSEQAAQLARVAAQVARSMPGPSAGALASLLPRQLPPSEPIVRAAMQVVAARDAAGSDFATLARSFSLAADRGAVPASTAGFVLAFQVVDGAQPEGWLHAVRRWVEAASKPLEARLAAALRGGAEAGKPLDLGQELRSVLMQARADEGMARVLQREGDVDAFRQALDRTIDRLTGNQAQNLRALEGQYLFSELPGNERFLRGQLHVLGDGGPHGGKGGASRQVVLDVSLTVLGDLWLALSVTGARCQCTLKVADAAVLPEVAQAAGGLEAALKEAGYPNSEVRVLGWDGDRVAAFAGILATHDRLDLQG